MVICFTDRHSLAAISCKTFSYRGRDKACLVSEHGIEYSAKFSYYEKNRVTPKKVANRELGETTNSSVALTAPKDPVVAALEKKTKAAKEKAAALQKQMKTVIIPETLKQIKEARAAAAKEIQLTAEKSKVALEEMKAAFSKKSQEKGEKQQNDIKLDFAKKELQSKVDANRRSLEETKEKGNKVAEEITVKGAEKAGATLREGRMSSNTEAEKLAVAAEVKAASDAEAREGAAVEKAEKLKAGEGSKLTSVELKAKLKLDEAAKDLKNKEAAAEADNKILAVRTAKKVKYTMVKSNEGAFKLKAKAILRDALLKVNVAIAKEKAAATYEQKSKADFQKATERQQKYEADDAAAKAQSTHLENAKITAIDLRQANVDLAKVAAERQVNAVKLAVFTAKVNQAKAEISIKETQHKTYMAAMDLINKKKRKFALEMEKTLERKKKKLITAALGADAGKILNAKEEASRVKKQITTLNKSWNDEKDDLIKTRNDDLAKMRDELDKRRAENRKALLEAKVAAKETVSKAQKRSEEEVARGNAIGAMKRAGAEERAEKSPVLRVKAQQLAANVVKSTMICDVAAYVDSGPELKGYKEYAPARGKFLERRLEFHNAKVKHQESQTVYSTMKKKHDSIYAEMAKNYERNMNATTKGFKNLKNITIGMLKTAEARLKKMKPEEALNERLQEIENGEYAGALNISALATVPPTPAPTNAGTTRNAAFARLDETELIELGDIEFDEGTAPRPTPAPTPPPALPARCKNRSNGQTCAFKNAAQARCKKSDGAGNNFAANQCQLKENKSGCKNTHGGKCQFIQKVKAKTQCADANCDFVGAVTVAPTPAPTAPPTYNQTMVRKLQRELNQLSEDSKALVAVKMQQKSARAELEGADGRYVARKTALQDRFKRKEKSMNATIADELETANSYSSAFTKAEVRYDRSQAVMGQLAVDAANHAFGKLPEEASKQGFLRLQHKKTHEQSFFLKFPLKGMHVNDTIQSAQLKLFKYGGAGGPVRVETASCLWQRNSITYSNSVDYGLTRASRGTTAQMPAAEKVWTSIELKGDVVQNARLAGDHICLRVSGGPADGHAVISSELTNQAPKLEVYAKVGFHQPLDLEAASKKKVKQLSPEEQEMQACSAKLRRELMRKKTRQLLKQNRIAAFKKAGALKKVGARGIDGMDIMAVLNMQIEGAEQAAALVKAEAGALKKQVKVVVSKGLTALANKNATDAELSKAVGQLRRQAAEDVGEKAANNAQQIQKNVNQGLAQDEKRLQEKHKRLTAEYYKKKAEIIAAGRVLTDEQKATMKLEVEGQVSKQAAVACKKIKPAEVEDLLWEF